MPVRGGRGVPGVVQEGYYRVGILAGYYRGIARAQPMGYSMPRPLYPVSQTPISSVPDLISSVPDLISRVPYDDFRVPYDDFRVPYDELWSNVVKSWSNVVKSWSNVVKSGQFW